MATDQRLDRAGWQPLHTRILLALGIGWALDSFEVQILGSVITPLAAEFGLLGADGAIRPWALSTIWTVWFVGLLCGAAGFGWLADRIGRKRLFVITLVVYSVAAILTALAPSFALLLVFRFVTALGVGGEYSAVTSAITEFVPSRRRGTAVAVTMNFWALGGIVAGLIGLVFLNGLVTRQLAVAGTSLAGWRLALLAGALAAFYALFARRLIPESPRWLAAHGRGDEAERVIAALTRQPAQAPQPHDPDQDLDGSRPDLAVRGTRDVTSRSFGAALRGLWGDSRGRLLYGMLLDFSGSGAYYGLFTFVGAYVLTAGQVDVSDSTVPVFYLIGNLGALLGGLAVAAAVDRLGRTPTVLVAYTSASLAVIVLAFAARSTSPALTLVAFTFAVFCATATWISAYTTFAELFPTPLRGTGIGVCVGAGRVGGIVGVVGLSYTTSTLGLLPAFILLAGFFAVGAVANLLWRTRGTEGRGRPLDDVSAAVPAATP